jgi:hypothetical protein
LSCWKTWIDEQLIGGFMRKFSRAVRRSAVVLLMWSGAGGLAGAHTGIVDGYGCHRGPDKVSYHCHQGQFVGRTFKSKEDFLHQLRGGQAEQLAPKNIQPLPDKRIEAP